MKKRYMFLLGFACLLLAFALCLEPLLSLKVNTLELPNDCVTVYKAKAEFSDVNFNHLRVEKVIKAESGFPLAETFISKANPEEKLKNIEVTEYSAESDMSIYNSAYDEEWQKLPQEEKDKYITISYTLVF